jgi:polysaccharide export outer membrane protein|tara:strand:+ start:5849 stop:6628 length:780 start_codon:yes stop_codon:yes gene_type:complete
MKNNRILIAIFSLFVTVLLISSCGINSNIMLKSPTGEYADLDSLPLRPEEEYIISPDDKIVFSISTNDGTKLIESLSSIDNSVKPSGFSTEYLVRQDSLVELPVLGKIRVAGLTIPECETLLEEKFSKTYQDPFVQVRIVNQRVIVFPGGGGDAVVIPLLNSNTTLMEVIAQAGGIPERGRANSVKLMRKENGTRNIYSIDLSTIEGLRYTDIIVQANDYIYIEPNPQLARETIKEIAPIVSLFSSALIILTVVLTLQN